MSDAASTSLRLVLLVPFLALGALRCDRPDSAAASTRPKVEVKAAVAPTETVVINSPTDGRLRELLVAEGASVKVGQTVATIVNAAVERDLAHARAQVALAESRLRHYSRQRNSKSDEREQAAASIVRNKAAKLERMRKLYDTRDVAEQEYREAENEYAAARRDWLAERERLANTISDPLLLRLEAEKARADELYATERKTALVVTSPVEATITRAFKRPGELIYTREPLFELSDNSVVEIRGSVAPELLQHIRPGSTVDVKVLTVPVRRFREPIARIVNNGGAEPPAIAVRVPNPDRALQPGLPAVITIE